MPGGQENPLSDLPDAVSFDIDSPRPATKAAEQTAEQTGLKAVMDSTCAVQYATPVPVSLQKPCLSLIGTPWMVYTVLLTMWSILFNDIRVLWFTKDDDVTFGYITVVVMLLWGFELGVRLRINSSP